jgi:hypothetical protein
MHWTRLIPLMILMFFCLGGPLSPQLTLAQGTPEPQVESGEQGLSLTWSPLAYSLTTVEGAGETYSQLQMPGTVRSGQPGQPELPTYSGLIGLPASGGAQLRIVDIEREVVQLSHPPRPAPVPQPVSSALIDPQSPPTGGPTALLPDPVTYASNDFYPVAVAELGPVQQMRQQRVARLIIHPLRVKPAANQMEVIRQIRLEITFDEPASGNLSGLSGQTQSTPFGQALAATLLNPEASQWQVAPAPMTSMTSPAISSLLGGNLLKVKVTKAGLYALTDNDLKAAGLPVDSQDPVTLQLSHGWPRQEVAIQVEREADGGFRLLFYAEPEFSRFVDYDVYFLGYGQANGLRMDSSSASPGNRPDGTAWRTATAEANQRYDPLYPGRDGDYWYWDDLNQVEKTSGTYSIQLEAPLTSGPEAKLTVWLQGYTDPSPNPDHRVTVSVNGTAVGEKTWNGAQAIEATFAMPANILQPGPNEVTLALPGVNGLRVEGTWLDALALTYPANLGGPGQLIFEGESDQSIYTLTGWPSENLRIYNVTDPANPHPLTGYQLTQDGSTYTVKLEDANTVPAKYLAPRLH